jgi:hypothetical protein
MELVSRETSYKRACCAWRMRFVAPPREPWHARMTYAPHHPQEPADAPPRGPDPFNAAEEVVDRVLRHVQRLQVRKARRASAATRATLWLIRKGAVRLRPSHTKAPPPLSLPPPSPLPTPATPTPPAACPRRSRP